MASSPQPQSTSISGAIQSERYLRLFEGLSPLVGSSSVPEIAKAACRLVADLLEVEACSILLYDAASEMLALAAATHIPEAEWDSVRLSVSEGICGHVYSTGEPVLLSEAEQFARFEMEPKSAYGRPSCVVVPLIVRGLARGVINIANPKVGRPFNGDDLRLFEAASRLIVAGIRNADRFDEKVRIQERLEGIFDNLHIGVMALDSELCVTHCNQRLREMRGQPTESIEGRPIEQLLGRNLHGVCRRLIADLGTRGETCQGQCRGGLGPEETPLEITASRLTRDDAERGDCLLMFDDVGQAEEVSRLREADSMKSGFLRIISHELRTPITVIRGAMPLLEACSRSPDPESLRTLAKVEKVVRTNVIKLSGVVNSILDVVEIENDSLKLSLQPTDLNDLIANRVEFVRDTTSDKGLRWTVDLEANLPLVSIDRQRMSQTLYELMDNAAKFSPRGGEIQIRTRTGDASATVAIANQGGTIDESHRERVFEKFHQLDSSATRTQGGAGLGLYLAKNILNLHGGDIRVVDGEEGQTVFLLELPLADAGDSGER